MFKIDTMKGHERMSTQDLLLAIGEAVKQGETDFEGPPPAASAPPRATPAIRPATARRAARSSSAAAAARARAL